ncbi:hypothetical protein ACFYR1_02290 [Streptomyces canus]|uniref:hypothetical protein n=1 Tax=Streptomyces canus TaxID=58343 RepID=UPI0036CD5385
MEQGPRTLTPYPVSQVARPRWPKQPRAPQTSKRTMSLDALDDEGRDAFVRAMKASLHAFLASGPR